MGYEHDPHKYMGDCHDTLLKRLAQHLQDMTAALEELIQEEDPVVGQRHVAGHRDLPAPDQPHI
jgi:hypothetical protein